MAADPGKSASLKFRERPCLKKAGVEQLKKTHDVWLHMHTLKHEDIHIYSNKKDVIILMKYFTYSDRG